MDAFEQIIAHLLMEDGYWTIVNYKADITQEQAISLKKGSMPRPDIDIVAYKPKENIIYLIEVKSFIDSFGVGIKNFNDLEKNFEGRYKILTHKGYRDVISKIVKKDLLDKGLIPNEEISVECGLIAGNLYKTTQQELKNIFATKGYKNWLVWGPEKITEKIKALAKKGYENNEITIISKLLNPDLRVQGQKERQKKRKSKSE
jgi:hypothetical protein